MNFNSYESLFTHRHGNQVIKMSWLLLLPSTLPDLALSCPFPRSSLLASPPRYLCLSLTPTLLLHCPCHPPSSPFLPVFSMSLYQEEKRGSPEGLWFVPAAAYTGLMRSLREGVSVSVYVCVSLFLCLCLCSCD